jgi:WD40 repeat protein
MTVRVWEWDGSTGKPLFTYDKHTSEVYAVSWSPDDSRIVSASAKGPIYVWAPNNGQTLLTYSGVLAVAWSHNGKYIASSGGSDIKTHVWNAQNGQLLHAFPSGPITSVSWSPDNTRIATANVVNNVVQVWKI